MNMAIQVIHEIFESGWTRQIPTFGEFNFYRPEGVELAKNSEFTIY